MGGKGSGRHPRRRRGPRKKRKDKQRLNKRDHSDDIRVIDRRRKVARIMIERPMTQREIAAELGVTATTINTDIKWLKEQYLQEALNDIEIAKAQVIRRMEYVLREAHDAWERSKAEQVEIKTRQKKTTGSGQQGGGTEQESSEKRRQTPGDVRFLEQFKEAAIEIASYEGVDKLDGSHNLNVKISLPDLPAEYSDFGLTPNLPESEQKSLPIPGREVSEVPQQDDIEDAEIIENKEYNDEEE